MPSLPGEAKVNDVLKEFKCGKDKRTLVLFGIWSTRSVLLSPSMTVNAISIVHSTAMAGIRESLFEPEKGYYCGKVADELFE